MGSSCVVTSYCDKISKVIGKKRWLKIKPKNHRGTPVDVGHREFGFFGVNESSLP